MKLISIIIMITTLAVGCSNSSFDCNIKNSANCDSISTIDTNISNNSTVVAPLKEPNYSINQTSNIFRTDEKVLRIWFAPFVDVDNNFHEACYINLLVSEPSWRYSNV